MKLLKNRRSFKIKIVKIINQTKLNFMTGELETGKVLVGTVVASLLSKDNIANYSGWILCDGREIPSKYSDLINAIGKKTPNLQGRTLIGVNRNHSLLKSGGQEEIILKENNIPEHSHEYDKAKSAKGGSHDHSAHRGMGYDRVKTLSFGEKHPKPFSVMQPFVAVNYIVYAGKSNC